MGFPSSRSSLNRHLSFQNRPRKRADSLGWTYSFRFHHMTSFLIHPEVAEEREEAARGHDRLGFWRVRNQVQPLAKWGGGDWATSFPHSLSMSPQLSTSHVTTTFLFMRIIRTSVQAKHIAFLYSRREGSFEKEIKGRKTWPESL